MSPSFYFGIDCTHETGLCLFVFSEEAVKKQEKNDRTQNVLMHVDAFLDQENLDKKDMRGILVATGSGSFMSNRMSCTAANGLAHALGIPALGMAETFPTSYAAVDAMFAAMPPDSIAVPRYASEPNIRMKQ